MQRTRTTISTYKANVAILREVAGKLGHVNPKDGEADGSLSELVTMLGIMAFRMSSERLAEYLRPLAEEYQRGNEARKNTDA